jgi:hypothetical protein
LTRFDFGTEDGQLIVGFASIHRIFLFQRTLRKRE